MKPIKTYRLGCAILVSLFLGTALTAQVTRDVPLKNWPTPLYWQPTPAETEATVGRLNPEVRAPAPEAATPAGSLVFVAMTPCRVVDTRASQNFPAPFGAPSLMPNTARPFAIQSSTNCTIPPIAQAYSFNVTVVPITLGPPGVGYLTIWPTAAPPNTPPNAVTLDDYPTGDIRNNAAIVPAGISNGSVSVITNATTDLVIDINGYFAPSTGVTLAQGTAGAPSLSFSGDAGTGIFSSGIGTLNLTTGGTNRLTVRSDGDLDLAGSIRKGGALFLHNLGSQNTAVGFSALAPSTTGNDNTAIGFDALTNNTTGLANTASGALALVSNTAGRSNTASGFQALASNTSGNDNTASGSSALFSNISGSENTASGFDALSSNTVGFRNTASGSGALFSNTNGIDNTAVGYQALYSNTTGHGFESNSNTAVGSDALYGNTTGFSNTAMGFVALAGNKNGSANVAIGDNAMYDNISGGGNTAIGTGALLSNTTANFNTASGEYALYKNNADNNTANGYQALFSNTTGSGNTVSGFNALFNNMSGSNNTAIGQSAGLNITTGSNNIDIGNQGTSSDAGAIRIGTSVTHTSFFAAGIRGVTTSNNDAMNVMIDSNGQLGTINSSRRFKEDIQDMGELSSGLLRLRPVAYRYQKPYADGTKPLDYGLIAEEVADVYPDLVVKSADGQIETVQYHKLVPMLLNELQKVQSEVSTLRKMLETQTAGNHPEVIQQPFKLTNGAALAHRAAHQAAKLHKTDRNSSHETQ